MLLQLANGLISLIPLLGFVGKRLVREMHHHLQAEQPTWLLLCLLIPALH